GSSLGIFRVALLFICQGTQATRMKASAYAVKYASHICRLPIFSATNKSIPLHFLLVNTFIQNFSVFFIQFPENIKKAHFTGFF
ncbi:MAG: hypothetical protein J1E64_06045, partial [Acetatifactor sp.]|nr:hypothetical protein [Acetatifactor sp.]